MVKITGVDNNSRAQKAGITAGDILIDINGREISDVLDYRFFLTDKTVVLTLRRADGTEYKTEIKKKEYDDIGLEFETPLMDRKHSCENKCIFCFIDQLPKGMSKTLYFKDDDSRLSFLHGNFITLTNLHEKDIDRIIEMHISPVNISVHTTNPSLRVKMMHNKRAGEVLTYMKKLADNNIGLCGQIVLCRGINDGEELDSTMRDLSELYPAMQSVSIVPAGLTRFRDNLFLLEPYTKEEATQIIKQVDSFASECLEEYGKRIFFCADELYLKAGLPIPSEEYYEDYSQIENGVGMIRSLLSEFDREVNFLDEYIKDFKAPKKVSIATGAAAFETIKSMAARLEATVDGLEINVYRIINYFFGESITVAGLLTGKDIYEQLRDRDLGDLLLFPENALRSGGDIFLDDMSPGQLSQKLGVKASPSPNDGGGFIKAVITG